VASGLRESSIKTRIETLNEYKPSGLIMQIERKFH